MPSSERELEKQLMEAGNRLVDPPSSVEELLPLLDEVESCLSKVEQSPSKSMQSALSPSLKALVADKLLRHSNIDVKVAVAACVSEITRITAPDAPYDDDQMKEVFQLIVSSFENISDKSSRSYIKRTSILETVAKVRSCVVMLDLECDALILEMFQHFLKAIRDYHPENVFTSMETVMTLVLEESEDISPELLSSILTSMKRNNEEVLPIARKLGERVLETCATKLKPYLTEAVKSLGISLEDYSKVVASVCQDRSGTAELNDVQALSEHMVGNELTPEPASPERGGIAVDKCPNSVVSNGITPTEVGKTLVDSESLEKQEHDHCNDQLKNLNTSINAEPNSLDDREAEKLPANLKSCSKDTPGSPRDDLPVDAAVASVNEKETGSQVTLPEALEGESVKRGWPKRKENLIKEVTPSADDVSKGPCKEDDLPAEAAVASVNEKETVSQVTLPEQLEGESVKRGRPKRKENLIKEVTPSADDVSKGPCEEDDLPAETVVVSVNEKETGGQVTLPETLEGESVKRERPKRKENLIKEVTPSADDVSKGPCEEDDLPAEAAVASVNEKETGSQVTLPEPLEGESVKRGRAKRKENLIKEVTPSADEVSKRPCEDDLPVEAAVASVNEKETGSQLTLPEAQEGESVKRGQPKGKENLIKEVTLSADDVSKGLCEEDNLPVEAAVASVNEKETGSQVTLPEALEGESVKRGRPKRKENLIREVTPSADDVSKGPCEEDDLPAEAAVASVNEKETGSQVTVPEPLEDESVKRGRAKKKENLIKEVKSSADDVSKRPMEEDNLPVEAAVASVNEKETGSQLILPEAQEGESVKRGQAKKKENLIKEVKSSADDVSKRPMEEDNLPVEAAVASVNEKETGSQLILPEAQEGESVKRLRPKRKENLIKEVTPSADDVSKSPYKETSDSGVKLYARTGKRVPTGISNEVKPPTTVNTLKKESGTMSDSEAKPLKQAKKVVASTNNRDGSSIKKLEYKKRGAKSSAKDDDKEMISSPKLAAKSSKHEPLSQETSKSNSKRKRNPGKENASEIKDFGAELVGSKVKVWWPEDQMFYEGVIDSFDPVKKKHKVLYNDNDEEILYLKKEKWELIGDESGSDGGPADDSPSPDSSSEMPQKKKVKTNSDPSTKQGKINASLKRSGGASSNKSKGTGTKSAQKSRDESQDDGKSKEDSKTGSKPEDDNAGKTKDHISKSGSKSVGLKSISKSKDEGTERKASKSRDDDSSTPKISTKSKQETPKAAKSKPDTTKIAAKSKGKSPKSGGNSKANGSGKVKSGSSKVKEKESEDEKNSADSPKTPGSVRGKLPDSSKSQGSEPKSGKKRRRGTKS